MARTAARVDMSISTNATWEDAFKFGVDGDTSWSFTGQSFHMDVKGTADAPTPLLSLSSADSTIVVDDPANRVLHFNVDDSAIVAALTAGETYVYDLVMVDNSDSSRVVLMSGRVCVEQGVTLT